MRIEGTQNENRRYHALSSNLLPTTAALEAIPAAKQTRTTSSKIKPTRPMI